jgi:hypothetical protein
MFFLQTPGECKKKIENNTAYCGVTNATSTLGSDAVVKVVAQLFFHCAKNRHMHEFSVKWESL